MRSSIRSPMVPILMVLCFGCQSFEINKPVRIEINVKADSAVFAVIGDYGKDGESEKTVASLVKGWDPDFILTTGDNNYLYGDYATLIQNIGNHYGDYIYNFDAPDAYQCHGKAFQDSINRFFPSPGNHDEAGGRDLEPYLNYFTLPGVEEFYAFTWGNAAFYSISSVSATNIDEQKIWLEKEIGDSKKPFQIVYFHHSPYSPGRHGDTEYMQWEFHKWGVDVVLSAHDHIYARLENPEEEGTHYIINGLGGKSRYRCNDNILAPGISVLACFDDNFGAMRCMVTPNRLEMAFYSIGDPGNPVDQLVILK